MVGGILPAATLSPHKTAAAQGPNSGLVLHVRLFLCCLRLCLCICLHVRRHLQQHTRGKCSAGSAQHSTALLRRFTRTQLTRACFQPLSSQIQLISSSKGLPSSSCTLYSLRSTHNTMSTTHPCRAAPGTNNTGPQRPQQRLPAATHTLAHSATACLHVSWSNLRRSISVLTDWRPLPTAVPKKRCATPT